MKIKSVHFSNKPNNQHTIIVVFEDAVIATITLENIVFGNRPFYEPGTLTHVEIASSIRDLFLVWLKEN